MDVSLNFQFWGYSFLRKSLDLDVRFAGKESVEAHGGKLCRWRDLKLTRKEYEETQVFPRIPDEQLKKMKLYGAIGKEQNKNKLPYAIRVSVRIKETELLSEDFLKAVDLAKEHQFGVGSRTFFAPKTLLKNVRHARNEKKIFFACRQGRPRKVQAIHKGWIPEVTREEVPAGPPVRMGGFEEPSHSPVWKRGADVQLHPVVPPDDAGIGGKADSARFFHLGKEKIKRIARELGMPGVRVERLSTSQVPRQILGNSCGVHVAANCYVFLKFGHYFPSVHAEAELLRAQMVTFIKKAHSVKKDYAMKMGVKTNWNRKQVNVSGGEAKENGLKKQVALNAQPQQKALKSFNIDQLLTPSENARGSQ
ncbi:hypothetical protein CAEBREN_10881 [Caenorhabditis brenneri]|uniref:Uncharacterized protein n=1 Tax=Caenorhabditis brenneri TaxID=135651 RepID=G0NQE4_CAEBE|nr:hypothetical protein CAEBREN_10881 [Caenorhabditis brenneri]